MSRALLLKTIKAIASPVLVGEGFVSADDVTWTRHRPPFMFCIEFQLRSDEVVYCVNLGVHMDFLPDLVKRGGAYDAGFTQADCEIKQRLAPSGESDHWWAIGDEVQAFSMLACLKECGVPFFDQFNGLPGPFGSITPETVGDDSAIALLPTMTRVRRILLLARIHEYLGDSERGLEWARFGMKNAGMAVGPKVAFKDIIRKLGN